MKQTMTTLLLVALVGCGGGTDTKTAGTSTVTVTDTSVDGAQQTLPADSYHDLVRKNVPDFASRSDSDLDSIGQAICNVLRAGDTTSWVQAVKALTDQGVDARNAGEMITYSAATFCVEKMSALPRQGQ